MNEYLDRAVDKLRAAKAPADRHGAAVFKPVVAALEDFCRQNAEFAQAVVQGGSVENCVMHVVKGAGSSLSVIWRPTSGRRRSSSPAAWWR